MNNCYSFLRWFTVLYLLAISDSTRQYSKSDLLKLREEVRDMFHHAYDGYLKYAYPFDELRPLTCDGIDTWGSFSLTLIDSLDTLAVMGNHTEFRRVVDLIMKNSDFLTNNINVSVFETNIRIIGGLLSAHLLSHRAGLEVDHGWPCNGPLLELAERVAHKLVAAFDTSTGMPYGTVNLEHGVPHNETTVTCSAGVGTFIVEFTTLSQLTGDPLYQELAMNALDALWHHKSAIGLVGNHIDIESGRWTAHDSGIGAGIDSYFEYLAKGAVFLQKPELMHMFNEYKEKIEKYLKSNEDWYVWASMTKGQISLLVFQSLEAYWPGVLSLTGDVRSAMKTLHNYHSVWRQYGFTPEFYNIPQGETGTHRESYPLRPELIESVMYLYRATGDKYLLEVGEDILRSIQHSAYTPCGYATIKDVRDHRKDDRMESFFLSETTKYLYLLFDPENFIHNSGQRGTVFETPWGECILDAGGYFFNTEAHPIDNGALHCCSRNLKDNIQNDVLDFDPFSSMGEKLNDHRKRKEDLKKIVNDIKSDSKQKNPTNDDSVTIVRLGKEEIVKDSLNGDRGAELKPPPEIKSVGMGQVEPVTNNNSSKSFSRENAQQETFMSDQLNSSDSDFSDKINFTLLFESIFRTEKKTVFEPQPLLERVRKEKKYIQNESWKNDYEVLRCKSQPFLTRITLNGVFFDEKGR